LDYDPAPIVRRFIEDTAFITALTGPLGCGKTSAGAIKAFLFAQANPGCRVAVIRGTWLALRDTTQRTVFEWLPPDVFGEYKYTEHIYHLRTAGCRRR
jgi:hypothetical protein